MKKIIIVLFLICSIGPSNSCFAGEMLSPRLNISSSSFQHNLLKPLEASLRAAEKAAADQAKEYFKTWKDLYAFDLDDEKLIMRKRIEVYPDEVEVHHTLSRIEADGTQTKLGQSWYAMENAVGMMEVIYESDEVFEIFMPYRKNGYGTVLLAGVIESAREQGIKNLIVIDPLPAIYEKLGFERLNKSSMIANRDFKPGRLSAFSLARRSLAERGKNLKINGAGMLSINLNASDALPEQSI